MSLFIQKLCIFSTLVCDGLLRQCCGHLFQNYVDLLAKDFNRFWFHDTPQMAVESEDLTSYL